MVDASSDDCASQTFQANSVIFTACVDASVRKTEGFRYLQIGSRGVTVKNSFERSEFETIDLA